MPSKVRIGYKPTAAQDTTKGPIKAMKEESSHAE